ncbi:hypothetical protein LWC34_31920 [Kibdelosporangium philippinense]|uniref:Uncharacterized protein n=1 Tax=Kibdelosporangium philippinense TaxID=211113 RepID=A0ABS8ZL88_9PSEU|nr:hypothetical protein [Kibdelosporangium philippinense]MCE7007391.1 hypothetical protein [Kibdelosporangium philippinense]
MTTPAEIKISLGVIGLGAVLFVIVAMAWDSSNLRLPVGAGIVAVAVCVGLILRLRFARIAAMVVTSLLALIHLLIALSDMPPWWVRVVSGLFTAGYLFTAVLVNTEPARHYLEPK